jgi:hypothetical protein
MASLGSLVIELAANTARLQGDLGRGVNMLEGFARRAKSVVGVLGVGVGAGGAVGLFAGLAKQAIELGDELQKGAQRAGVSASTFSQLAAAAKQADVDIGSLSLALKNMQVAISTAAQGGKEAQSAFRQLGIDLDTLRGAKADEQLKIIADALKRVPDPAERARLGTAALGKAYLDLVPLLDQGRQGITALVEEQKKLGTLNDEQIKALSDADDALKKLSTTWTNFTALITAKAAPELTKLVNILTTISTLQKEQDQNRGFFSGPLPSAVRTFSRIREELAHQERLDAIERRGGGGRGSRRDNRGFNEAYGEMLRLDEATRQARESTGILKQVNPQIRLEFERGEEYLRDLQRYQQELDDLQPFDLNEIEAKKVVFKQSLGEMSEFAKQAAADMQSVFAQFLFDPFSHGVRGMLKDFVDVIRRMVAEAAAAKILGPKSKGGLGLADLITGGIDGLFGGARGNSIVQGEHDWLGKIIKGAGSIFGTIFGGPRAMGGPVSAGVSYLVGERGPERFVPGTSGFIVPNGAGGTITFAPTYNIDARGATTDLIDALPAVLRANNEALRADILDQLSRRPPPSRR